MKKPTKADTILLIGLVLCVGLWMDLAREPVRTRNSVTLTFEDDPRAFDVPPLGTEQPIEDHRSTALGRAVGDSVFDALRRDGELASAVEAARHLAFGQEPGRPVVGETSEAYLAIVSREDYGLCSDYAQVLAGLCTLLGIPVREWGMTYRDYKPGGHALNEIYDYDYGKWIAVDSYLSAYWTDSLSVPLSFLEVRAGLLSGPLPVPHPIDRRRFDWLEKRMGGSWSGFFRKYSVRCIMAPGDVLAYDRNPIAFLRNWLPTSVYQGATVLLGYYPRGLIFVDSHTPPSTLTLQKYETYLAFALTWVLVGGFVWRSLRVLRRGPEDR